MGTSEGRTRGCRQRGSTSSRVVASAVVLGILAAPLPSAATSLAAPVLLTATDAAALPTLAESVATDSPFDTITRGTTTRSLTVKSSVTAFCQYSASVSTGMAVAPTPMSKPRRPRARAEATGVA